MPLSIKQGPVEIKILGAGSNWLKVSSMIGLGLTGYYSKLPKGSSVSIHTAHTGEMCLSGPELVDTGVYHFGMTPPPWLARIAREGRGAHGFGESACDICAVAVFPHFDQLALAVRKDLALSSLGEVIEQKIPLRISTAPIHLGHPVGWTLDILLAEYGSKIEDFNNWGGKVVFDDRQPNFLEKVPGSRPDRVTAMKSGELNAVFDEALMTRPWKEIADNVDLTFLEIEPDVLHKLHEKYGISSSFIPKNSLRGVLSDLPTIDFAGWIMYCHSKLPEELVYLTVEAIEQQAKQIETLFQPGQGLTSTILMSELCQNTDLPLHEGAQKYYVEKGYLS